MHKLISNESIAKGKVENKDVASTAASSANRGGDLGFLVRKTTRGDLGLLLVRARPFS